MSLSSVLGVFVLYENEFELTSTFKSIQKGLIKNSYQFEVLLYDNSSTPHYDTEYFELGNFKVHYIHNSLNPGIGKAYNKGAELAEKLNKKWLLLLDQDTEFNESILRSYLKEINNNPRIKLFAPILMLSNDTIFSPCLYLFNRGFTKNTVRPGINSLRNTSPVNSGLLINTEAFIEVGGYNDQIKLDFSDFQFIERYRTKYKHFFIINEIGIQDFSNAETDPTILEKRFNIYCVDARNCSYFNFSDPFFYFINSLFRAIKLAYRTKKIRFLKIWLDNFLL